MRSQPGVPALAGGVSAGEGEAVGLPGAGRRPLLPFWCLRCGLCPFLLLTLPGELLRGDAAHRSPGVMPLQSPAGTGAGTGQGSSRLHLGSSAQCYFGPGVPSALCQGPWRRCKAGSSRGALGTPCLRSPCAVAPGGAPAPLSGGGSRLGSPVPLPRSQRGIPRVPGSRSASKGRGTRAAFAASPAFFAFGFKHWGTGGSRWRPGRARREDRCCPAGLCRAVEASPTPAATRNSPFPPCSELPGSAPQPLASLLLRCHFAAVFRSRWGRWGVARGGRSAGPRASIDADPAPGCLHPAVLESAGIPPCRCLLLAERQPDRRERHIQALPPRAPRPVAGPLLRVVEAPGCLPWAPMGQAACGGPAGAPKRPPAPRMEPGSSSRGTAVTLQHPALRGALPACPPPCCGRVGTALRDPARGPLSPRSYKLLEAVPGNRPGRTSGPRAAGNQLQESRAAPPAPLEMGKGTETSFHRL